MFWRPDVTDVDDVDTVVYSKHDWLMLFPRQMRLHGAEGPMLAERLLLEPYVAFFQCKRALKRGLGVEHYFMLSFLEYENAKHADRWGL